jgi:hypothetical protein
MANRLPHPIEILPQDNDRLFVLVSVGGTLRLDLGRKVPHATEHAAFLREVDTFVYKQFLWNSRLLLKRNLLQRGQTPQGFDVQQQLASVYAKVRSLETVSVSVPKALSIVFPRRTYLWPELEVEALFTAWLSRGLLPGLALRGIVGYVAPLDLILEARPIDAIPAGFPDDLLPADIATPCKNPVWAETKVLLSDLVEELLDPRKPGKDLAHIDLVVVRDLDVLRLRHRLAQVVPDADEVLAASDISLADSTAVDLDSPMTGTSLGAISVTLTSLQRADRCYSGAKYKLRDNLGNEAEVLVTEELVPIISGML